jgi:hypothetical protein
VFAYEPDQSIFALFFPFVINHRGKGGGHKKGTLALPPLSPYGKADQKYNVLRLFLEKEIVIL